MPTHFATVATNDLSDRVAMEIEVETDLERVALDDLLVQCMPGFLLPHRRESDALERAAKLGLNDPLELWFSHQPVPDIERDDGLLMGWSESLKRAGDWDNALRWLESGLADGPSPRYRMEMGILNKTCGKFADAAQHFIEALRDDPDLPDAPEELAMIARECLSSAEVAELARQFPRFGEVAARRGFFDPPRLLSDDMTQISLGHENLARKQSFPDATARKNSWSRMWVG